MSRSAGPGGPHRMTVLGTRGPWCLPTWMGRPRSPPGPSPPEPPGRPVRAQRAFLLPRVRPELGGENSFLLLCRPRRPLSFTARQAGRGRRCRQRAGHTRTSDAVARKVSVTAACPSAPLFSVPRPFRTKVRSLSARLVGVRGAGPRPLGTLPSGQALGLGFRRMFANRPRRAGCPVLLPGVRAVEERACT